MIRTDVREAVTGIVAQLAEVFGTRLSEARVELYVQALGDLAPGTLSRAAQMALERCKRFPMPAELRELAFERRVPAPSAAPRIDEMRAPPSAMGRVCLAMIAEFLEGKISKADYLRGLRELDADYPQVRDETVGTFGDVANALEDRWSRR